MYESGVPEKNHPRVDWTLISGRIAFIYERSNSQQHQAASTILSAPQTLLYHAIAYTTAGNQQVVWTHNHWQVLYHCQECLYKIYTDAQLIMLHHLHLPQTQPSSLIF